VNERAYRQLLDRNRDLEELLRAFRNTTVAEKYYPRAFLAKVDAALGPEKTYGILELTPEILISHEDCPFCEAYKKIAGKYPDLGCPSETDENLGDD
jgi:hypothetical protein